MVADAETHGSGTEKYRFYLIEGQSTRVDSVDVIITSVLGIADQQEEEVSVSVYPNPVSNVLTVSTKGLEGSIELKIVDVLGKVVLTESGTSINKVDVSNFKNGVYLVYIQNKGNLVQTKRTQKIGKWFGKTRLPKAISEPDRPAGFFQVCISRLLGV